MYAGVLKRTRTFARYGQMYYVMMLLHCSVYLIFTRGSQLGCIKREGTACAEVSRRMRFQRVASQRPQRVTPVIGRNASNGYMHTATPTPMYIRTVR